MNRGKKLKQMKRFINKYGTIMQEYKNPPKKDYQPYRKGSYFIAFSSDKLGMSACATDADKYEAYKAIVNQIKWCINRNFIDYR